MTLLLAAHLVQDSTRLIRDLADERFDALKHRDPEVRVRAWAVRRVFDWPKVRQEVEAMHEEIMALLREYNRVLVEDDITYRLVKVTPSGPAPPYEAVENWIKDLASDSLSVREAATRKLRKAGSHVEAPLQEAAASRDREVAYRARAQLRALWRVVREEEEEDQEIKKIREMFWELRESILMSEED